MRRKDSVPDTHRRDTYHTSVQQQFSKCLADVGVLLLGQMYPLCSVVNLNNVIEHICTSAETCRTPITIIYSLLIEIYP